MAQSHELEWVKTLRSGAQVWRCPMCGHWVIRQLAGDVLRKVVLRDGNRSVNHYISPERGQISARPEGGVTAADLGVIYARC